MDSPGPSNLKRGRDELEEGEEEESNYGFIDDDFEPHKFGTSVLPVANLPASFDGIPQDGMEYLFTVRREEKRLPLVTRVHNPYHINDPVWSKQDPGPEDVKLTSSLPSEEWRTCFEERFRNFRANTRQSTIHVSVPRHAASPVRIPETHERDRWWAFLRGDADWEKVRGFPGQATGRGTNGWHRKQTINYDEELPKNQGKMRGWVVYDEPLSWDQDEDVAADGVPSAGPSGASSVGEDGLLQEDEISSDAVHSPPNGNGNEVAAENTLPTPRDSPHPEDATEDATDAKPGILPSIPREPTLELLNLFDENATFQVLKYFTMWIRAHLNPSSLSAPPPIDGAQTHTDHCDKLRYDLTPTHARWMFALLSRLDAQLTSEEISALRTLVREIIRVIKEEEILVKEGGPQDAPSSSSMGEVACWMIVAAVAGVWGQRDLWMDAEAALR